MPIVRGDPRTSIAAGPGTEFKQEERPPMPTPPIAHLVAFDELGKFVDRPGFDAVLAADDGRSPVADVLILSHGWNNNLADATALYRDLLAQLDAVEQARPAVRPP